MLVENDTLKWFEHWKWLKIVLQYLHDLSKRIIKNDIYFMRKGEVLDDKNFTTKINAICVLCPSEVLL